MKPIVIREFDYLICVEDGMLDDESSNRWSKNIPKSAYKYLERLMSKEEQKDKADDHSFFLKRTSRNRKQALQLQSFVGVLQTPCGTCIEILPKTATGTESGNKKSREMLLRMLRHLKKANFKLGGDAHLNKAPMHLLELFITYFLQEVNTLVKRGVRSDYITKEENQTFLKGKLLIHQQIRANAVQQHRFFCAYDEYEPNRPENRLIHTALLKVSKLSQNANNQRLSRELMFVFADVPVSRNIRQDFAKCKSNRAMTHYHHPLEWCRLILNEESTVPSSGITKTISILFPMEKIFEDYVAAMLKKYLPAEYHVVTQASGKHLCIEPEKTFALRPDIVIKHGNKCWVADTKWKLIDKQERNHGISQSDMYQLYAYGKKYEGCNGLFLIYPKSEHFNSEKKFKFEESLELLCLPFACEDGQSADSSFLVDIREHLDRGCLFEAELKKVA